ncbi:hypothetical protein ACFX2H_041974 [Malus domestica]
MVLPDFGPYTLDFTSSSRYIVIGGRKGHLAIVDLMNMRLVKKFQEHVAVSRLQFLDKHYLLASINNLGQLHYQDMTNGVMAGSYRTGLRCTNVMQVNPYNGCRVTGAPPRQWHSTLIMATAGKENKIKLWDLRKLQDEPLQTLPGHTDTLAFSQKGLLAYADGSSAVVLKDLSRTQSFEEKTYDS